MSIYMDNAATTQVCPEAAEAAYRVMRENYGNPSSTHLMGRKAKQELDTCRKVISGALGSKPEELYFTSCGSESDNWAIIRGAEKNRRVGKHIISSMAEHDAVLKPLEYLKNQGYEITLLRPESDGSVSSDAVLAALREDTCLVTLMMVNNETGGVTDISEIARKMKSAGSRALLHTDAVQAFLKVPFSASDLGADMISISGHKINAPKGIGALYVRKGLNLPPFLLGGGQEDGHRAGTEALPQIAAFAAAVEAYRADRNCAERMSAIREHMAQRLTSENGRCAVIEGKAPHILSFSLPGYRSEVIMNFLEAKGIMVSKSSACKKGRRSHVLEAIGIRSEIIDGAIRAGLSRYTTMEEADIFCDAIREAAGTIRTSLH